MKKRGARFKTKRDPDAFRRAIGGVAYIDDSQQVELGVAYRMAYEALKTGSGVESHFHTLACTANIALVMCERGFGTDYMDDAIKAQDAIVRCFARSKSTDRYLLDGDGISSIARLLELHDAQLEISTNGDLRRTVDEVYKRINARMPGHQVMELV
ncbi:MAG: hypothetical protein WC426_02510 [Sulfuriferula sp.]